MTAAICCLWRCVPTLSQDWPDKELVVFDDGDHEAIVSSFVPGAVYVKVSRHDYRGQAKFGL